MKRCFGIVCLLVALTWVIYGLVAHPLSARIAQRWGPSLLRAGDGKFTDAAVFLQNRLYEANWLLTCALGASIGAVALGARLARRLPRLWRHVAYSATGFAAINVWIKLAMGTCLFWCLFWNGKGTTDNLTQFYIKLRLMDENPAPSKIVLAGSSQVRTEIDHRLLNKELGTNFFAAELHFPGNRGYDFLFLDRELQRHRADVIVCYLSELNFFTGGPSEGFQLFFGWGNLPEFARLGGRPGWFGRAWGYGLLGDLVPAFRLRDVAARRVLGEEVVGVRQRRWNASLAADLEERAAQEAPGFVADAQSAFHFAALEDFVARCRSRRRTVVLCCGELNPVLARKLNPALRPEMVAFLRRLASRYDHVVLLEQQDLPLQTEKDYQDLTHVDAVARARFTVAIARSLERLYRQGDRFHPMLQAPR